MKIVETNIIYSESTLCDHQSRVLEIPSWEEYCDLYINYDGSPVGDYENVYRQLIGYTLPKGATIIDLLIDDVHLTCNMNLWDGSPQYKLAYVIER